jgi:hypothetical protein
VVTKSRLLQWLVMHLHRASEHMAMLGPFAHTLYLELQR